MAARLSALLLVALIAAPPNAQSTNPKSGSDPDFARTAEPSDARSTNPPATKSGSHTDLVAGADSARRAEALRAGVFTPPRDAPDFTLRGSDGSDLVLSRHRGKVVILEFGFTSCPDVCPTTLKTLADAHRKLGDKAAQVQLLYITVDPDTDDAERLKNYLAFFDKRFLGGTGSDAELSAVRKAYGIMAERVTTGQPARFNHSSFTYLIDRGGKLRALMPYGQSADDYVHDLEILLKEDSGAPQ